MKHRQQFTLAIATLVVTTVTARSGDPACNDHGTLVGGVCVCNVGFVGPTCGSCAPNYYNYPTCTFCLASTTCNGHGTCNTLGGCNCSTGFAGPNCNQCAANYYNYPSCTFCLASTTCNGHGTCNSLGGCNCSTGFTGPNCSSCAANYYNYPNCTFCLASTTCNGHGTCNTLGGCNCSTGYAGAGCNQCAPGYQGYPNCVPCANNPNADMNGDTLQNINDITAFVMALLDPATFVSTYPSVPLLRGDLNCDGILNGLDIRGFVQLLTGV